MDAYSQYYHQYQNHFQPMQTQLTQPIQPQLPQQQFYNMNYYYPNEVLYPDYNAFPQQADFSKPYQVYNLEKPVENTDYFLYAPQSPSKFDPFESRSSLKHDSEIEEILRSNPEVWQVYKTGRFRVLTRYEDNHRKIILRENVSNGIEDSEFIVRRYKVLVSSPRNSRVKEDHVLLVSFSHKSLPANQRADKQLEIEHQRMSNANLIPYRHADSQIVSGPGTELINRIVNGEDSFEILEDAPHYEPAYEIQTSPSKTSSRGNNKLFYEKTASSSTRSTQTASSNPHSEAEDYIDEIINKIKSQVSRENEKNDNTHISVASPVSVKYIGEPRYGESVIRASEYGVSDDGEVIQEYGNVSRSSTRNVHGDGHDTHSIGPGSMAGGSLFGGYIPSHVEHVVLEKSAFSEYNLTRNSNGDYVLQEANGKSEIFDGKSGYSLGKSNVGSRSQLSRGEETKSNISRLEEATTTRG